MIDLAAPIIPGESAAGIRLGAEIKEILAEQSIVKIEELRGCTRYDFESVSLWVRDGFVSQIGVFSGYSGKFETELCIGATIKEVQDSIGAIVEDDEDNLVVKNINGLCFDTEPWVSPEDVLNNLNAKVNGIYVYSVNT